MTVDTLRARWLASGASVVERDALVRSFPPLNALFALVVLVMIGHEDEHVTQLTQKQVLGNQCPKQCRGMLGSVFDVEWVHFAYNVTIFLVLAGLWFGYRMWRPEWRRASLGWWAVLTFGVLVAQGYHVVEHTVKIFQWNTNGHHSPTPGLLGRPLPPAHGHNFSLIELHFLINTVVLVLVVAGWLGFRFHRHAWAARAYAVRGALTLAAVGAVSLGLVEAIAWATTPPTEHLAAGIHRGPLVVDRTVQLVGERGTVVRGGIVVTADRASVRGITVEGGDYGIDVENAHDVSIRDVTIRGAALDGIHVRRSNVSIRDCYIDSRGNRYGQGIDISFVADQYPSRVEGCTLVGGQDGIVTHFGNATISGNHVLRTSHRGIAVNEMSMDMVRGNHVQDALGVGIFCGDYSECEIEDNKVAGTRPDLASGDRSRLGYAIVSHFHAHADVKDNTLTQNARGLGAFLSAQLQRRD